jgi:hypothetical protein
MKSANEEPTSAKKEIKTRKKKNNSPTIGTENPASRNCNVASEKMKAKENKKPKAGTR